MSSGITYNLIVYLEGQEPCQYDLRAQRIGLGRGKENHVQVDSPAVSAAHLELHRTKRGYELEDLLSSNGTMVNGFPIQKCVLQDGDRILIGGEVVAHFLILPEGAEVEEILTRGRPADESVVRYLALKQRLELLEEQIRDREHRLREVESKNGEVSATQPALERNLGSLRTLVFQGKDRPPGSTSPDQQGHGRVGEKP